MILAKTKKWLKNDQTAHLVKGYKVLSPDGFEITCNCRANQVYKTIKEARQALKEWIRGYEKQGYYSQTCYNGYVRQISLDILPDYIDIIKI